MTTQAHKSETMLRQAVTSLVPGWRGAELDAFEFLPWGYSNRNYRFQRGAERYALRLPAFTPPFVDRRLEWDFYRRNERVRTVEVVAFDVDSGAMISRWHQAPLLADHPAEPEQLLRYVAELHAALPAAPRVYDPLALTRSYLEGQQPDTLVQQLLDAQVWQPSAIIPCHNDLNPWNVLRDDGEGWVTLDWEWHAGNDPLFDLVTLQQGLGGSLEQLSTLAAMFLGSEDPGRVTGCLTAYWLREHAWACAELHRGNERSEILEQRDGALDRLRSLAS